MNLTKLTKLKIMLIKLLSEVDIVNPTPEQKALILSEEMLEELQEEIEELEQTIEDML